MSYKNGYDKIVQQYANYATNINKEYDELKAEIENKLITDEYTEEMKQEELTLNESNRKKALDDNGFKNYKVVDSFSEGYNLLDKKEEYVILIANDLLDIYLK